MPEVGRDRKGACLTGKRRRKRRPGAWRKRLFVQVLGICILALAALAVFRLAERRDWTEESYGREDLAELSLYAGKDSVELNGGRPDFTPEDARRFPEGDAEHYSPLDAYGRCGSAEALLHRSLMPQEGREPIGGIRPSGWHGTRYPDLIEDGFLYNRCHLIAFAMTGQNANERNLFTGTRYLNTVGMYGFEVKVLEYLESTQNHVLYRVTPYYEGQELVARGVEMEALSVEDGGRGIRFHVFVYNHQPGITIDYRDGSSRRASE